MPSGRVHETINLGVLGALAGGYYGLRQPLDLPPVAEPVALCFSLSYLVGTFLITPDLDLAEQRVRAKGYWGVLGWIWVPYGLMFSHRGLSHSWLAGPLTRLVYLGAILGLGWLLLQAVAGYLESPLPRLQADLPPAHLLWSAVGGYYLSQWLHLAADGAWPDQLQFKKRRR